MGPLLYLYLGSRVALTRTYPGRLLYPDIQPDRNRNRLFAEFAARV